MTPLPDYLLSSLPLHPANISGPRIQFIRESQREFSSRAEASHLGFLGGGYPEPNIWLIFFPALYSNIRHYYRRLSSCPQSREESTRPQASERKAPYDPYNPLQTAPLHRHGLWLFTTGDVCYGPESEPNRVKTGENVQVGKNAWFS